MKKCHRLFYPKRRLLVKRALEKLLQLPHLKFDENLKEFNVFLENGEILNNVNVIDYLCFVTDPDPNRYVLEVEVDTIAGLVISNRLKQFDTLILEIDLFEMKKFLIDEILLHFQQIWPSDYHLADFILTWIINHPNYYYNYIRPTDFSLFGKGSKLYCVYNFISSVADTEYFTYKNEYKKMVNLLIDSGAPECLFHVKYCIN